MTTHSPNSLIKYCEPGLAVQLLTKKCLRWSSPDNYCDPFELTAKVNIGFDQKTLLESMVKLASSMLFSSEHPKGDSPLVNAIKRWRTEERFSTPEEAHDVLRDLLSKMVSHRAEQLSVTLKEWQAYVFDLRLCCFCDKPDNLVAWEKYANLHQGIALGFNLGTDESLSQPKKVIYQSEPPQLTTIKEQLTAILQNKDDEMAARFNEHYLNKGVHHKQESEWRLIRKSSALPSANQDTPAQNTSDVPFTEEALAAVYFGLKTSVEEKKQITNAVKENYKNTKIFQIKRASSGYVLEAERL